MESRFDTHLCSIDEHKNEDGKIRVRFWDRDKKDTTGNCRITLKLTDKERLDLIHMLSE